MGVSNRKSFFNAVICVFLKMVTLRVATSLVEIKSWKEKEKQEFVEDSPSAVSSPRSSPAPQSPTSAPSTVHGVEPLFLLLLPTTLSSDLRAPRESCCRMDVTVSCDITTCPVIFVLFTSPTCSQGKRISQAWIIRDGAYGDCFGVWPGI